MKQHTEAETISKSDAAKHYGSLQAINYMVSSGKLTEVSIHGLRYKRILMSDLIKQLRMELKSIKIRDRKIKNGLMDLQEMIDRKDRPENYGYLNYPENAELIQNRI
jgi:hypothetical protein